MKNSWSAPYAEYGPVFVRFLVGFHLFYGNWGRLVHHAAWLDFNGLLVRNHFPFPTASTWVSAAAQVICGILYMLGLFTRARRGGHGVQLRGGADDGALGADLPTPGARADDAVHVDLFIAARSGESGAG